MEPGRLTSAERGGSKAQPKPEAVLKWAHTAIAQLAGLWSEDFKDWQKDRELHPTPPVFIIVCRNTRLAKVLYEWIVDDNRPLGIPALGIGEFRNRNGQINTIRVDSKVVHETDTEGAKNDEHRWMRFTLDTVGKTQWTLDSQRRPIYPKDFAELAAKLERPLHPPGRDVRCIVSVAMLTEGWDCTTVTHIIGLRPFMSQLLCEQVVGRGLRRERPRRRARPGGVGSPAPWAVRHGHRPQSAVRHGRRAGAAVQGHQERCRRHGERRPADLIGDHHVRLQDRAPQRRGGNRDELKRDVGGKEERRDLDDADAG